MMGEILPGYDPEDASEGTIGAVESPAKAGKIES